MQLLLLFSFSQDATVSMKGSYPKTVKEHWTLLVSSGKDLALAFIQRQGDCISYSNSSLQVILGFMANR